MIIIQIHQDVYGSLKEAVPATNADSTINNSQSFKYKAPLVRKIANARDRNSFVKDTKIVAFE